jgi:plastocyanin
MTASVWTPSSGQITVNADNTVYTGVSGFPLNGVESVDFTLPVGAPSTLRYVCDAHASMSGVITVVP